MVLLLQSCWTWAETTGFCLYLQMIPRNVKFIVERSLGLVLSFISLVETSIISEV